MTTPLKLSASVSLTSGQSGLVADTRRLSVPFREMCEVHEVNWTLTAPLNDQDQAFELGSFIRTKISMGRVEITRNRSNGFIPIWNFGVPVCAPEEWRDTISDRAVCNYRWKLPVPLIIPRGQSLVSQFSRDVDTFLTGAVKVTVAYGGRYLVSLTRRPKQIDVPFVSFYEVPATATSAISDSQDLVNPFGVPLHVQRLLARVRGDKVTVGAAHYYVDVMGNSTVDPTAGITIQNSMGEAVVNNPLATNLPLVFPVHRRSWTFGRVLNPGERFIVRVQDNVSEDVMISMIGHRKEVFG